MSDFEKAIWNAIQQVFPDIVPFGCHFHFKQAVRCWLASIYLYCNLVNKIIYTLITEHRFGKQVIAAIMEDVDRLYYAASEAEFYKLGRELMATWKQNHPTFTKYFENTWFGTKTSQPRYYFIDSEVFIICGCNILLNQISACVLGCMGTCTVWR